jgi:selenocysteine-specific translation elongation factor
MYVVIDMMGDEETVVVADRDDLVKPTKEQLEEFMHDIARRLPELQIIPVEHTG